MQILIAYPAVEGFSNGNHVTAQRWSDILQSLGHTVAVTTDIDSVDATVETELLIALHAVKSSPMILHYRNRWPHRKLIVAITGTDLYNAQPSPVLQRSLELADRIVVLQEATESDLPRSVSHKVRVVYQSMSCPVGASESIASLRRSVDRIAGSARFEVCVVGHLRTVKDPFLTAKACQDLPNHSRVQVTQIGAAMSASMEQTAIGHAAQNDRYRWIGNVTRAQSVDQIAASDLLVNSSKIEGGAAVITEAIVVGTPVLASRISGNWGLLGKDYDGLFEVGNCRQLRTLILQAEHDGGFYQRLQQQGEKRKQRFHPDRERDSWAQLLAEFA